MNPRLNDSRRLHPQRLGGRRTPHANYVGIGRTPPAFACCAILVLTTALIGCARKDPQTPTAEQTTAQQSPAQAEPATEPIAPQTYSASADELLAARLTDEETAAGWVRLFDGHTLFGWEITGNANFRIEDGAIVVDQGEKCLLCTSTTWGDFELTFDFKADEETNSGVFVRTPLKPENVTSDCYEINIAPDDNPFPTGSIVQRQKVDGEAAGPQTPAEWRTMSVIADGKDVTVSLDGNAACRYTDPVDLAARRIGLQHNSGRVAFKNIKIRPLGMQPMLDADLSQWKKYPEMEGTFTINDDGDLHVLGGKTQLETRQSYGDFFMLAEYKIDDPEMNSGIFFRCIPGDEMMGYECQINNGFKDGNRLTPLDCGTGGIFRRQDARVIAGENGEWSTVLLHASGNRIAAWVGGVQVSDWEDTREEHENPRKGKRTSPGTIMIQGHDPKTDVLFRNLQIAELR
ncbi:3-keto-disaccharide hydrolase [Planctomycetes bacterium TBK1r]|uniref:3-keto-alpha-glucoside-1,2-lyase/3-keto-2-hydroxy-glucal hydratase domain-containing protein n=1 Tax=Stieleria magnilauensis TaxID=2527963 RepID=A0ABX5Y7G9_9BACT|nr:hypothetical protein TBK1r_70610 [Planctomycetes bacterium TBK1r]